MQNVHTLAAQYYKQWEISSTNNEITRIFSSHLPVKLVDEERPWSASILFSSILTADDSLETASLASESSPRRCLSSFFDDTESMQLAWGESSAVKVVACTAFEPCSCLFAKHEDRQMNEKSTRATIQYTNERIK